MILTRSILGLSLAAMLYAHPMGNFSVSHYTRFDVQTDRIAMTYSLDLAEIPTFELLNNWKLERTSPRAQLEAKAREQAAKWVGNLRITSDGRTVRPRLGKTDLVIEDGAGNMPVLRITSHLDLALVPGTIDYEDTNFAERAGWKEIVIRAAQGVALANASHGSSEKSQMLTAYPADPTVAPPQDLKAHFSWSLGTPAISQQQPVAPPAPAATSPVPPGSEGPGAVTRGDYLSRLLRHQELSTGMILLGLAVAFGLGSVHALSPGHGKTLVAAYLVGSRGTWKHATFLGGMVTFTHTISVFALGFVTLFLSEVVAPETLTPILGAISGLTIVWIGAGLLIRRIRRLRHTHHHHHHHHDHDHGHNHHHHHHHDHDHDHDHDHHHGPGGHTHMPDGDVTMASLIALGASGGLVPCPSALVLLLSAISLERTGLGLMLLVAFSMGLAVVLTAIGLAVVYARQLLPDSGTAARHPAFKLVPVFSAAVILCIGVLMTCVSLGIIKPERILG